MPRESAMRQALLSAIIKKEDIAGLLDIGCEFLDCPLLLVNQYGEVLSRSGKKPHDHPLWNHAERYGYIDHNLISDSRTPCTHAGDMSVYRLADRQHPFSVIVFSGELSDGQNTMLSILGKGISFTLETQETDLGLSVEKNFVSSLLDVSITDELIAADRARNLRFPDYGKRSMVVLKLISGIAIDFHDSVITDVQALFPGSYMEIYRGNLVVLVFELSQAKPTARHMEYWNTFLRKRNLQACVCPPAGRYTSLAGQYRQAMNIFTFTSRVNRSEPVLLFEQYMVYNLICHLGHDGMQRLLHPYVRLLMGADREWGTQHVSTMYAFILMYANPSDAAHLLNLSYNAMKYRLARIDELIGPYWRENMICYYLSIKILMILYPGQTKDCLRLEQTEIDIKR